MIFLCSENEHEHQARLELVLQRIKEAGITLNKEKCEIGKIKLKFLGKLIDQDGVKADPDKVSAIRQTRRPDNLSDLRRFMGMVHQLGKFSANHSELSLTFCVGM